MKPNLEKLKEAYGNVLTLKTPTGYEVTIREQTGEDDDILSNAEGVMDGTASNKFVAGIVVHTDITENNQFNLDTARDLKLCDKYFIMVASRVFSIGQYLKFAYEWPDKLEVDYEEDLGLFLWDYHDKDKPFPEIGHDEYYKHRIPPHIHGKDSTREFSTKSGKSLQYKFMNGHGERFLMELPTERQSVNAELLARGIELKVGEEWVKIQNFKTFTPMDMMEIRNDVSDNDPSISLVSELEHPKTGDIIEYPIVGTSDFFYPREI